MKTAAGIADVARRDGDRMAPTASRKPQAVPVELNE
jgi:hypothetical protein